MTSYTNVPLSSNVVANDVTPMNNNTNYIATTLGKDHQISIGGSTGNSFEGRHKQVSLNDRSNNNLAMPGDGTDSLVWSSGGNLFWKNTTVASGVQISNSAAGVPSIGGASPSNGFSWLPGGAVIQWGTGTGTNATPSVFTFPTAFLNNCFSVVITPVISNTTVFVQIIPGTISKTGFSYRPGSINSDGNNPLISFIAIGN